MKKGFMKKTIFATNYVSNIKKTFSKKEMPRGIFANE
jgi:hypothetical protein